MQSVPIYEKKTYYNEEYNDENPETEMGLTTGFGVKINPNLSLDIFGAYSFLNYDENYAYYNYTQRSNEYSYSKINIGCSMGYNF